MFFSYLLFGEKAKDLYILLGIVYGFSQGVYWVAGHNIIHNFMKQSNSKKYITTRGIFTNICKIIFPIILGTSIHFSSFTNVGIIILFIAILQIAISFFMKDVNNTSTDTKSFNILTYLSKLRKMKEKASNLYHCYLILFYSALAEGVVSTLITVMIMMTFGNTLDLGFLTTCFSICTIITVYLLQRFYQKEKGKKYILTSLVFMLFSSLILVFDINKSSVIFYNLCQSIFIVIISNIANFERYNTITDLGLTEYISEHQALCEVFLAFGRMVAYSALLIVSFFTSPIAFRILLLLLTLCLIPYAKHILAIEKNSSN